jgi:L-ascorbate metabolism protein UlaG (beta-lactamase superfamily)
MQISDDSVVYLKQNFVAEPLVNNWYAWSHLISPATAALNIKERHLKIMNSYIQNPQIHAAAVENPKMLGGPFIDYGGKRVDEIKQLRDRTLDNCAEIMEFGDSIGKLNDLLQKEAKGYSLIDIYPEVPAPLRGYVELFYDLNNNPSYRFFEALLYKSNYYNESLQSLSLFLIDHDGRRSFVLSTPKLDSADVLNLRIPFRDGRIDMLFDVLDNPKPYGWVKDLLGITAEQDELFRTFFTTEAPPIYTRYAGNGVLTRYFGHASIFVETRDTSLMVDPVVSYSYESDISRFTYSDLPDTIDYVLFTHNHQDHILFETLLRLRKKIKNLVVPRSNGGSLQDPNLRLMFKQIGFENIIELGDMEQIELGDCTITGLPFLGEHADLDIRTKLCHMVEFRNGYKVIFAADSCNIESKVYEKIHQQVGDIDILFLGMECDGAPLSWLYGPLLPKQLERDKDQSRRLAGCNFEQSKALIEIFKPRDVFIYAMGLEPWLKFISSIKYTDESRPITESNRVLEYCRAEGIGSERLFGEKVIEY